MAQAPAVAVTRYVAGGLALALVVSLLVLSAGFFTGRADAMAEPADYGRTFADNGVLKRGCRTYRYSYEIMPPEDGYWVLETFIIGPKGKRLASGAFMEGYDEISATAPYRICRATTRPGVFKIEAKLSTGENNEIFEVWLPATKYRLRARH